MTGQPTPLRGSVAQPDLPQPAAEAGDQPRLDAEDLEKEIGDAETWDEASENSAPDGPDEISG